MKLYILTFILLGFSLPLIAEQAQSSFVGLNVGYENSVTNDEQEHSNLAAEFFARYSVLHFSSKLLLGDALTSFDFANAGLSLPLFSNRKANFLLNFTGGLSLAFLHDPHTYIYPNSGGRDFDFGGRRRNFSGNRFGGLTYNYDPILNVNSQVEVRYEFGNIGLGIGYRQRFAPEFLENFEDPNGITHAPNTSEDDNRNVVDHANFMLNSLTGVFVNVHIGLSSFGSSKKRQKQKIQESNFEENTYAKSNSMEKLEISVAKNSDLVEGDELILKVKVKNITNKPVRNVRLNVEGLDGYIKNINGNIEVADIKAYTAKVIEIPIRAKALPRKKVTEELVFYAKAENYKSNTKMASIHITRPSFNIDDLQIVRVSVEDDNGNGLVEPGEQAKLRVRLRNTSNRNYRNLKLKLKKRPSKSMTKVGSRTGTLSLGALESKTIKLPLKLGGELENFTHKLYLEVNGKPLYSKQLAFQVSNVYHPQLAISQVNFVDRVTPNSSGNGNNSIEKMETIEAQIIVANTGLASSNNTVLNIEIGDRNIVYLPESWEYPLGSLQAGETRKVKFSFLVNNRYAGQKDLPIYARIKEDGETQVRENLNLVLEKRTLPTSAPYEEGEMAGELAEESVDINIPVTKQLRPNTFALVIGNENYSSYQISNTKNVDVDYAINDAEVFRNYLIKTLGVPERNITFIKNATIGKINQALDKIEKLNKISKQSDVIFYYAGHGLAHDKTKEPYIMPVDIDPGNIEYAIRLEDITNSLAQGDPDRVSMFVDACFSGNTRDKSLTSYRGAIVKPKEDFYIHDKVVLLSSSSGTETSGVYASQKHGLFTYYLLKKIKESRGNVKFGVLYDYVSEQVQRNSLLINNKTQTPSFRTGLQFKKQIENEAL